MGAHEPDAAKNQHKPKDQQHHAPGAGQAEGQVLHLVQPGEGYALPQGVAEDHDPQHQRAPSTKAGLPQHGSHYQAGEDPQGNQAALHLHAHHPQGAAASCGKPQPASLWGQDKAAKEHGQDQAQVTGHHVNVANGALKLVIRSGGEAAGEQPQGIQIQVLQHHHSALPKEGQGAQVQEPVFSNGVEAHNKEDGHVAQLGGHALVAEGTHPHAQLTILVDLLGIGAEAGTKPHEQEKRQCHNLLPAKAEGQAAVFDQPVQGGKEPCPKGKGGKQQRALPFGTGNAAVGPLLPKGKNTEPQGGQRRPQIGQGCVLTVFHAANLPSVCCKNTIGWQKSQGLDRS